jgi:hypothetical protein
MIPEVPRKSMFQNECLLNEHWVTDFYNQIRKAEEEQRRERDRSYPSYLQNYM